MSEVGVNTASDTRLMHEVKRGKTRALATLFERHHARLYRYCLKMTGDRQASEDLVQDVFMKMLKYRKTFKHDSVFAPWMFRIARNSCVRYLDSSATRLVPEEDMDLRTGDAETADEHAAEEQRARLVRRALSKLPVDRREVLILSRYEFKTYDEIGRALGCSAGAVKVRAHRAMKELKQIYFELSGETAS